MKIAWSIWRCRWSAAAALIMDGRGIARDRMWHRKRDRVATLVRGRWFHRNLWISSVAYSLLGGLVGSLAVVLVRVAL